MQKIKEKNRFYIDSEDPIHLWFGLSYSSYLVLPRSFLQSLPIKIQKKLVEVLEDMQKYIGEANEIPKMGIHYRVESRDDKGRWTTDIFRDYERGRRNVFKDGTIKINHSK